MQKPKLSKANAIAHDGTSAVSISAWTTQGFSVDPHLTLTVGALGSPGEALALKPAQARQLAIRLLQEASRIDNKA